MNEFIALFQQILQQVQDNFDNLSPDEVAAANEFIQEALGFIQEESQRQATPEAVPTPPGADLLWILSGGQPEAFVQYLTNFPNAALNALVRNPTQLTQLVERLNREMPRGEPAVSPEGVEHAPLQSSNIWGFRYNPKSGKLLVKFNSGSVYGYEGVPPFVFKIFASGAIPAKTNGQNSHGKWWKGKSPSLGASFFSLVKMGGYPYTKLK